MSIHSRILASLPQTDRGFVERACREVPLPQGQVLAEAQSVPQFIYFPTRGVVSTIARFSDGSAIEMATIGREGCTGIGIIIGGSRELATQVVQVEGEALVLRLADFKKTIDEIPSFKAALTNYAQAFTYQILVTGACNGKHDLDQRLARWLLQMQDRERSSKLRLTQEFLAEMTGVRRQSVNLDAGALQESGLIAYRRGTVDILDRDGLEAAACECYGMVKATYDRLLPQKE